MAFDECTARERLSFVWFGLAKKIAVVYPEVVVDSKEYSSPVLREIIFSINTSIVCFKCTTRTIPHAFSLVHARTHALKCTIKQHEGSRYDYIGSEQYTGRF
jgi:hypothetical protein